MVRKDPIDRRKQLSVDADPVCRVLSRCLVRVFTRQELGVANQARAAKKAGRDDARPAFPRYPPVLGEPTPIRVA
jgi:hypothetical protein